MQGMRKFFCALAVAFLAGTAAFSDEDRFGGLVGAGLIVPIRTWNSSDWSDSMQENAVAFNINYYGITYGNLAAKAELSVGKPFLTDSDFSDYDTQLYMSGGGGLGYAFINNERFMLAVMGNYKFGFSWYGYDKNGIDLDMFFLHNSFGVSLDAACRVAGGFAVYGGLDLAYSIGSAITSMYYNILGVRDSSYSSETINSFMFAPRIGLAFSW